MVNYPEYDDENNAATAAAITASIINSTLVNPDDLNDLSDLFDSSQGELLAGELSEIQDVNDLVSAIKSSPLRSLMISPHTTSTSTTNVTTGNATSDIDHSNILMNSTPPRKALSLSNTANTTNNTDYGYETEQHSMTTVSFISPAKVSSGGGPDALKKCTLFSPSQVFILSFL